MDDSLHRRSVRRPVEGSIENVYKRTSPSSSHGNSGSQSLNLRNIKTTSLNCAKNLTNKLIHLSNSSVSAATSAINQYKEGISGQYRNSASASQSNSFPKIAERISTSSSLITTHRELVAVLEYLLQWNRPPVQVPLERDCFGAVTKESMSTFRLINDNLLDKVLLYITGRRDCCLFILKFTTWRMRTTKCPEDVILCLELLYKAMECLGGYLLILMTKSLMSTFRKLVKMTTLRSSIAHGVRKHLTKLLVGTSHNVHPGVPTDIRIHIIKAKVLYMLQLWHDAFLLEQGNFPVFFQGYRNLRASGIKFPTVCESDKAKINHVKVVNIQQESSVLTSEELQKMINAVDVLNKVDSGPQYEVCLRVLRQGKTKLEDIIGNMAQDCNQESESRICLLERLLKLNDAIHHHLELTQAGTASSEVILERLQQHDQMDLLDLDSSSDSELQQDEYDGTPPMLGEDDIEECDYFSSISSKVEPSDVANKDYFSDLQCLDFGSGNITTTATDCVTTSNKAHDDTSQNCSFDVKHSKFSNEDVESNVEDSCTSVSLENNENDSKKDQTSLKDVIAEFDKLDFDFGHMSVTGF